MNCREEFLDEIAGRPLLCTEIMYDENGVSKTILLHIGFIISNSLNFLRELDFEYDSESSNQKVFGVIWYKDGSWSERGMCGGSERWVYRSRPVIPEKLMNS